MQCKWRFLHPARKCSPPRQECRIAELFSAYMVVGWLRRRYSRGLLWAVDTVTLGHAPVSTRPSLYQFSFTFDSDEHAIKNRAVRFFEKFSAETCNFPRRVRAQGVRKCKNKHTRQQRRDQAQNAEKVWSATAFTLPPVQTFFFKCVSSISCLEFLVEDQPNC